MTAADFLIFYPQFSCVPQAVLEAFADSANLRFDEFEEDAEEARRLFTAHRLTLYARTVPASGAQGGVSSFSALASSGDSARISGKKVDDVAISYSSGVSAFAASRLADLQETLYGQQLLSLLRMHSYPRYVP